MAMLHHCIVVAALLTLATAEYSCVCSYSVERKVYVSPGTSANVIGYMYEFDCKKTTTGSADPKFKAIEFHHQLGFVADDKDLQAQICQGDPPAADLIPTTTQQPVTSSAMPSTSIQTTKPTTVMPTTSTPTTSTPTIRLVTTTTQMPTTTTPTTRKVTTTTKMPTKSTPTTPMVTSTTQTSTTSQTTSTPTTRMLTTTTQIPTSTKTTSTPTTRMFTTTTQIPTSTKTTYTPTTRMLTTTIQIPTSTKTTPTPTTRVLTTSTKMPLQSTTKTSTLQTTKPTTQSTTTTPSTTQLPTFPPLTNLATSSSPLKYLGVGYKLLDGNPGAMDITLYGSGGGLMVYKRIFQLTQASHGTDRTAREGAVTINSHCTKHNWSKFLHDGKSYQDELSTFVKFGDTSSTLSMEAFTFNSEFNRVRQDTEGDSSTVYRDMISSCISGSVRYKEELANVSHFSISRDFATDICKLPEVFEATQYLAFIDKWGTNIVMSSEIGTLKVDRYKTNGQQVLLHLQKTGQGRVVYPSTGYKGYGSSVTINSTGLDGTQMSTFGVKVKTGAAGSKASPAPIIISLAPITAALDSKYWTQVVEQQLFADVCSDNFTESVLRHVKSNLNTALQKYVAYRRSKAQYLKPLTDHPVRIPMVWPYGTYGLMQAASGCPGGKVPWGDGFRLYDTEDSGAHNYFSDNVQQYLAGSFAANNIMTRFCMKTDASVEAQYDRSWPNGSYCLLRRAACPIGFTSGYIYWDDDDISNDNVAKGVLPDGAYNHNTKIYYCCRNDGSLSTAILLPREKPFVLIRFGDHCQTVFGMEAHEVIVRWDDEDIFNSDGVGGAHPFDDGGSDDHKLHFCHYRERPLGMAPGIIG